MQNVNVLLSDTLFYENEPILLYKVNYPKFQSNLRSDFVHRINSFYEENAKQFIDYVKNTLYPQAVKEYHYRKENNYPVIPYEAVVTYRITYMMEYYISLYTDQYIFTAGAHGNTIRSSETWDIGKRRMMQLSDFFPHNPDYRNDIISFIIDDIKEQLKEPDAQGTFFDTYEEDVKKTFDENNFYLTKNGIIIYFQQYDIAPYSSGIQQFLIPFS